MTAVLVPENDSKNQKYCQGLDYLIKREECLWLLKGLPMLPVMMLKTRYSAVKSSNLDLFIPAPPSPKLHQASGLNK